MDMRSFKQVDWVVLATGVISFIALFLPWWGVSFAGFSGSVSGWNTSYGWLGGVLVVIGAAWYVITRGGVAVPELPVSKLVASLGATLLGFVIILIRWLTLPRGGFLGHTYHYGGRVGIWIAAIAAAVQLAVLVVSFRRSGEDLPWKSTRRSS